MLASGNINISIYSKFGIMGVYLLYTLLGRRLLTMLSSSRGTEEHNAFGREYVVHGDGEYTDDEIHVDTCESHVSQALAAPRCLQRQAHNLFQSVSASPTRLPETRQGSTQNSLEAALWCHQQSLTHERYRKPGRDTLKHATKATLWNSTTCKLRVIIITWN